MNAIVTGAGRGIGAAVAHALSAAGWSVLVVSRTGSDLERVCSSIRSRGGAATAHVADVSASGAARDVADACERTFGTPGTLVNAAAVQGAIGPLADADMTEWWRVLETNLRSTVEMSAAVLPHMIERGRGSIINFSGGGATAPMPRFTAYACAKAAIVRFTESLAEEVRGSGVTVNAIAPGMVDTGLQDAVLDAGSRAGSEYERVRQLRSNGTGVAPELAADLVVHIAMGRTGQLTGKLLSAPHDDWRTWDDERITRLSSSSWLTLRRLDDHTLQPLLSGPEAGH